MSEQPTATAPSPSPPEEPAPTTPEERARGVLQALHDLLMIAEDHGDHQYTRDAATWLHSQLDPRQRKPWSLQFVRGAVFYNRALLDLHGKAYEDATRVARALRHLNANELTIAPFSTAEEWALFGKALADAANQRYRAVRGFAVPHITWQRIQGASGSSLARKTEDIALTQIALALQDAPRLLEDHDPGSRWPWSTALNVLGRIDRAVQADAPAARRAIELAPGGWTIARRSVSAALQTRRVLEDCGLPRDLQLIGAHISLALCIHGLVERNGYPTTEAAAAAEERLCFGLIHAARGGALHHHMRTCVGLQQLAHLPDDTWLPMLHMSAIAYDLERVRCPDQLDVDLTLVDLLAHASREMGTSYHPLWVKALIRLQDEFPPGAHVQLQDGRHGVVLGFDQGEVEVLVAGQLTRHRVGGFRPTVQLISTLDALTS